MGDEEMDVEAVVIPHSGQEPQSEALEHLIEHVLPRRQEQLDFLQLATD